MKKVTTIALLAGAVAAWVGFAFSNDWPVTSLALVAPPVLMIVLHRPAWGLWILVLAFPLTTAYSGAIARSANFVLPLLILGSWFIQGLWRPREISPLPGKLPLWFALFTGWMLFTSFFSNSPALGMVACFRYLLLAILLVAFINLWSRHDLQRALVLQSLILVPLAAYALWQAVTFTPEFVGADALSPKRWYSIYESPNKLGVIMGHGIVILISYLVIFRTRTMTFRRGILFGLLILATLFLAGGLAVSISRSSYLYVGFAIVVLVLSRRELWFPTVGLIVSAGAAIALLFPSLFIYGIRPGSGMSLRDSLWLAGLRILNDHPWTGIGTGADVFESIRADYITTGVHRALLKTTSGQAHNVFLTKGAEMGWVGLLLTLAFFLLVAFQIPAAIRAYQRGDWIMGAAAAGFVGLSVRALFESGVTLGAGHIADSLIFFFFVILLISNGCASRISPWSRQVDYNPLSSRTSL